MDTLDSILISIKKLHGISANDTSFDPDMIIHINSALMALSQLGVGPSRGYYIQDESSLWSDYISDDIIAEAVKSFVYVKVRLVFDPPSSPTVKEALKNAVDEYTWRITQWADNNYRY